VSLNETRGKEEDGELREFDASRKRGRKNSPINLSPASDELTADEKNGKVGLADETLEEREEDVGVG